MRAKFLQAIHIIQTVRHLDDVFDTVLTINNLIINTRLYVLENLFNRVRTHVVEGIKASSAFEPLRNRIQPSRVLMQI